MKERVIRVGAVDIAMLALSAVFLLGILLFFGPCAPAEDGTWRVCHWAGRAVTGAAAALAVMMLFHTLLSGSGVRQGLDLAALTLTALIVLLPGRLIDLCSEETVRCRTVMLPAIRVFAVLLAAATALDLVIQIGRGLRREAKLRGELRKYQREAQRSPDTMEEESDSDDADGADDEPGADWESGAP